VGGAQGNTSPVGPLVATGSDVEIALCDTTGRADPAQIHDLFGATQEQFSEIRAWAFHDREIYDLGGASVLAAWDAGARIFDAAGIDLAAL